MFWTNLTLIKFVLCSCVYCTCFSLVLLLCVQMSPFKTSAVKGGNSKGIEPVIDVDNLSPRPKRTRLPIGVFDPDKFRSYVAF